MTVSDPKTIIERIKAAEESSPIAVFKVKPTGLLDAVFANTSESQKLIRDGGGLVGVFHGEHDLDRVRHELNTAAEL